MPNPKKPRALKVVSGTVQPSRDDKLSVELPPVVDVPEPPEWLPNAHAVKEWKRLAPILVANKLLTDVGLSPLGNLCALHGKMVQLWAAGEAPVASMVAQYRNLINDFGMTPVSQGKVKPVGEEPAGNKFAQRGKRAA
ncbi:P27 family phage terminase small subunit [Variovorax sp. S2]|uniref:P27 family phage terminase small subunit n=1 Tax=Variovorax sp. S12S4 TaxID=3029170 RepID=UPI00215C776A|nr:P27 family phage terminase small subunit [Variovorax sp. S12S4]MCR8961156.1 P27 family phage terminase small subunit [Variovorax sp. S12S4]